MESVNTLAQKFGKTSEEVVKLCRKFGTIPVNNEWSLPEELVQKIENQISSTTIRPVAGASSNTPANQIGQTKSSTTTRSVVSSSSNTSNAEEEQIKLLSRKYIFVTLTAMEKPGMEKVLRQILELRMNNNTQSQLFAVSTAIDQLKRDATTDLSRRYLQENARMFNTMREKGFLNLLEGSVAQEGLTIGSYIRKNCKGKDPILVLGKNMSLNTCVFLRNQGNAGNQDYVPVQERGISSNGFLQYVNKNNDDDSVFGPVGNENEILIKDKTVKTEKRFTKYKVNVSIALVSENKMELKGQIPGVGDYVYVERNNERIPIMLESIFHEGGVEGAIYTIAQDNLCAKYTIAQDNLCAKIFFAENITERKLKKLSLLCDNYVEMRGRDNSVIQRIGWPQNLLYNDCGDVVGYLMLKFLGVKPFSSIAPRKYSQFVKGSKENQIVAAVSLVELIRFLHDNNVILCDINQGNILFDDDQRAYLVDLDSAQITEPEPYNKDNDTAYFYCYPANVACPQFLPPEHIDTNSFTFRHDKKDDIWAMQYMVFLLLTMDGAFFPYKNDATTPDGKQDIREGNYQFYDSYTVSRKVDEKTPLYSMHCVISRLSQELRRAFYDSFDGKGRKFAANNRSDARVWMRWLVKYYYELPKMKDKDTEDGKYLPSSIKYESSSSKTSVNAKLKIPGVSTFLDEFDSWLASN